jgi:phospholipid/cholesterol/gamma-HCH transport system ATP-binding protein
MQEAGFSAIDFMEKERIMRRIGILYQSGVPWSSMTLAGNVAFPLERVGTH